MHTISVLTAVHSAGAAFLNDAARSVLGQEIPADWALEWVVQEDGEGDAGVRALIPDDSRINFEDNGSRLGAAGTRNLGLRRVRGELVQNLDADDLLLPGALLRQIEILETNPQLHWVVGQADDLMPDGSRKTFPPDLPFGIVEPGRVNDWAFEHGGNWPIHCAGLMYRTATLRAMGGWGGLPFDEDLVLFAALSEVAPGWFDDSFTWLYRQHPDQLVRSGAGEQWGELSRSFVLQRVRGIRAVAMNLSAVGPGWDEEVPIAPPRKSSRLI